MAALLFVIWQCKTTDACACVCAFAAGKFTAEEATGGGEPMFTPLVNRNGIENNKRIWRRNQKRWEKFWCRIVCAVECCLYLIMESTNAVVIKPPLPMQSESASVLISAPLESVSQAVNITSFISLQIPPNLVNLRSSISNSKAGIFPQRPLYLLLHSPAK